jgi:hypothetical protein
MLFQEIIIDYESPAMIVQELAVDGHAFVELQYF